MKKTYENLEIEVVLFEKQDVLAASTVSEIDTIYLNFNSFFAS